MKNKRLISLLTLTCLTLIVESQFPENFPIISGGEIEGAEVIRSRTFSGSALYGYMNGGAELYQEYGFTDAVITEMTVGKDKYKVEIFRMNNPESAFGIFSVSKFKCIDSPGPWKYVCRANYQLQICRGRFYISIINSSGSKSDSIASVKIAGVITRKIDGDDFDLTEYFPGYGPVISQEDNVFLAKGKLGIVNGSPDLEDYFRGAENYTLAVLQKPGSKILSVKFVNPESLSAFMGLHKWESLSITGEGIKTPSGEILKKLPGNHLIIEILL